MLSVTHAKKRLGARAVLDGVDLCCAAGEIALVLGQNGSGKSTLLRAAAGIFDLDAGSIEIAGHSLRGQPTLAKSKLGYAPDGLEALPDLRASEYLSLVRGLRSLPVGPLAPTELEWRERLGIAELAGQRLHSLSFGQRKRVALAAALSGSPPLLLFDEPSSGLDPTGVDALAELIRKGQRAGHCHVITSNDAAFMARVGGTRHHVRGGRLVTIASEQR